MLNTIKGEVTDVKQDTIEIKGTPMIKTTLKVTDENGQSTNVQKYTRPETNFTVGLGTKVQVSYEQKISKTKDGKTFTNNSIMPKGLTILQGTMGTGNNAIVIGPGGAGGTTAAATTWTNKTTFDPNGQKRGNAVTNGLTLALARKGKNTTKEDVLQAAQEIYEVSTALENPSTLTFNQTSNTLKTVELEDEESPFND